MCGIAGIVRFDDRPIDTDRLRAMLAALRCRGPDDEGVVERGRCALAHARLSILDLAGGRQPMEAPQRAGHGPLWVAFNGEIYNHRDLRRQLEGLGHEFRSDHSDTEVLLHGYRQWGSDLPRRLQGMFAVALWDAGQRRLFLCRDRIGKKPLYLLRGRDGTAFASTLAAILPPLGPGGASPTVDRLALLQFLRLGYTGDRSLIEGLEELPPAHRLLVDEAGRGVADRYWSPPGGEGAAVASGLRDRLAAAVERRLEADVPLGCFLSGGIDSSIVAALAQQALSRTGRPPLRTFHVAMPDAAYDESPYAAAVAQRIGATHTPLQASPGDLLADLDALVASAGEPLGDSSWLPTLWVSRSAREHVKVVLSGDGGDELFGGYERYRALRLLQRHRVWLSHLPTRLLEDPRPRSLRTRLRRLAAAARWRAPARQYQSMVHLFTDTQIRALGLGDLADAADGEVAPAPDWPAMTDPVAAAMRWDLLHYLPHDLLRKVDRASMAVALEVRCPLLDTEVIEFAARLPVGTLMPRGRVKGLLRRLAADLVGADIAARPKRGFAIPIGQWFRGALRAPLQERLRDGSLPRLGLVQSTVDELLDAHLAGRADHAQRLFGLLSLAAWRRWLDGAAAS